ncbi:hypothetical protein SAMN05216232_1526 [Virgibacillus subterraneus]|uniref:Lipoprotein n=2 Tax=Virgibacillus TaxID=84406 RepID=A0A1H1AQG6_9BACI|nr:MULTISPECIES: hypothetical protein [Virgibacillus]SDQ41909.1 hypothetical protein SAMN05216231_1409 [Virgibacillus salinus]SEQ09376.1 hypothetical protein SAMN05216232_1526 [Virgibacillus subterraneus]
MRKSIRKITILSLLFVVALTGCSLQTEEEAIKDAKESAKKIFDSDEKVETNHKLNSFSMYLPNSLEVEEKDANNVILKDGDQTFIVFYNNLEDPLSKLSYNSAAAKSDEALLLETFEDQNKFGYMRIIPHDQEEDYELQIGVGGVKITTYTSREDLDNDSEELMKIAQSIALQQTSTVQK